VTTLSLESVPTEIWALIFDSCDVRQIFRISRTCRGMKRLTTSYWNAILNPIRVLRPFFVDHVQMVEFLKLLDETGAIVSGSTALQLFARTSYEDTDLDLYVERIAYEQTLIQMQLQGFHKIPQDDNKLDNVIGDSYPFVEEIERVQGLTDRSMSKAVIQVIATKRSPIYAVLNFHSSTLFILVF
jgi:hypothetical protein